MDQDEVAIATMTWARDPAEGELLLEALGRVSGESIPVAVADGGGGGSSGRQFLEGLRRLTNFTVLEAGAPGVLAQARLGVKAAGELGRPYVLYTEPDKKFFFEERLRAFISDAPGNERQQQQQQGRRRRGKIGVVLASRSAESFLTYPPSQQYAESVINHLCAESFGTTAAAADYSYGPFIFARELLPCLELIGEDVGWGWRHFLFGAAHRLGYEIVPWVSDLPCPAGQREDGAAAAAERLHRMQQLSENVRGLALALALPVDKLRGG